MKQLLTYLALGLLGGACAYALLSGGASLVGSTGAPQTGQTTFAKPSFRGGFFSGSGNQFEVGTAGEENLNSLVTAVTKGTCAEATTTLFAVSQPFGTATTSGAYASSTANLAEVTITGLSTSTAARLTVATSSLGAFAPNPTVATSTGLFSKASLAGLATNTPLYSGVLQNSNAPTADTGIGANTLGSASSLYLGPADKLVGWLSANGSESLTGYVNAVNLFSCTYKIRWTQ